MTVGSWTVFDLAKPKFAGQGDILLDADTCHIVLCTSAQALAANFAGTSTNAQYSDLTGELTTANGYTAGGVALTGVALTETSGVVHFDSNDATWTLTGGGITFKYAVIVDWTTPNKDLLCFLNMDTGGGSVSPLAGTASIQMNVNGIFTIQ